MEGHQRAKRRDILRWFAVPDCSELSSTLAGVLHETHSLRTAKHNLPVSSSPVSPLAPPRRARNRLICCIPEAGNLPGSRSLVISMRMPTRDVVEPKTPTSSVTLGTLLLSPSSRLRFLRRDLFSLPQAPFSQTARRTDRPAALPRERRAVNRCLGDCSQQIHADKIQRDSWRRSPSHGWGTRSGPRNLSKFRIGNVTGAEQRFDSACPSKAVSCLMVPSLLLRMLH